MISITFSFETPAEAAQFLAEYSQAEVSAPVAPKPAKPAKAAKGKVKEAAAPKADVEAAEKAYEGVKAAALKLTHTKGRDKLVEVLGGHGYTTAMDCPPENYPALIASMEAATATEDAGELV